MQFKRLFYYISLLILISVADASCPVTNKPAHGDPSIASGWDAQVVATRLNSPRGIIFDQLGQLVVVEKGSGLRVLKLSDSGGVCVTAYSNTSILADTSVSHKFYEFQ